MLLFFISNSNMLSGCPEIPDYQFLVQFTPPENVTDVLRNGSLVFTKQLTHLSLRKPSACIGTFRSLFDFRVQTDQCLPQFIFHHYLLNTPLQYRCRYVLPHEPTGHPLFLPILLV